MSSAELALIVFGAALAGFVQGLSGFGFGLVSMSLWAWGLAPQLAAVLSTVGGFLGQVLAALTVRRGFGWAEVLPFLVGGVLGLPLGLVLLQHADPTGFRLFVGAVLTIWCPIMLLGDRLPAVRGGGRVADALAGAAGGAMGPLGGFTGALPSLWCSLRRMDRDVQRAVMQNFNLVMLGITSAAYVQQGLFTRAQLPAVGLVAVTLVVPALLGMRVYLGISPLAFRRLVLALLTASGAAMLVSVAVDLVRQTTAASTSGRPSSTRAQPSADRSSVTQPPSTIHSASARPTPGACCSPCPLKPLANSSLSSAGCGPTMALASSRFTS